MHDGLLLIEVAKRVTPITIYKRARTSMHTTQTHTNTQTCTQAHKHTPTPTHKHPHPHAYTHTQPIVNGHVMKALWSSLAHQLQMFLNPPSACHASDGDSPQHEAGCVSTHTVPVHVCGVRRVTWYASRGRSDVANNQWTTTQWHKSKALKNNLQYRNTRSTTHTRYNTGYT